MDQPWDLHMEEVTFSLRKFIIDRKMDISVQKKEK